jgi:hypothetical protein
MSEPLVIRGRYADRTFIPGEPLPDAEGAAELIVTPNAAPRGSMFDHFGKAPQLRTAEDIAAQLRDAG